MGGPSEDYACKIEASCFKLKGEDFHFKTLEKAEACINGATVTVSYSLLGVFDGHGGKKCAEYTAKQFPATFSAQLHRHLQGTVDQLPQDDYAACRNPQAHDYWILQDAIIKCTPSAFQASFIQIHEEFLLKDLDSGTTATVALICGTDIICANVGDSLAFLDDGLSVREMSGNHRIDSNASERERLIAAGGDIAQSEVDGKACGPLRIWPGGLAMSRSIGDRHAGARVIPEPHVSQVSAGAAGARVIVASDGLWDAMNNNGKSAAHRVRNLVYTKAASRLRSSAREKRDRDDITVLVADILSDGSMRLPAAFEDAYKCAYGDCDEMLHQVWYPLLEEHKWEQYWSGKMKHRQRQSESSTSASCDLNELPVVSARSTSNTCSQDSSQHLDSVISPGLLYEQVKSMMVSCAVVGNGDDDDDDDDGEWVTVPQRRGNPVAAPGQHESGKYATSEKQRGRGRGRGRGRKRQCDKKVVDPLPLSTNNTESADAGKESCRLTRAGRGSGRGRGSRGSMKSRGGKVTSPLDRPEVVQY